MTHFNFIFISLVSSCPAAQIELDLLQLTVWSVVIEKIGSDFGDIKILSLTI